MSSGGGSNTTIGFAETYLDADMDVTLENQFAISRSISYYHELGMHVGLAMYKAWVQVDMPLAGDFDEDGDIDHADLTAWQIGFGIIEGAAHYQGDADSNDDNHGDEDVDGNDFLIWQRQYDSGSSLLGSAVVPEPESIVLLFIFAVLALAHCHRY